MSFVCRSEGYGRAVPGKARLGVVGRGMARNRARLGTARLGKECGLARLGQAGRGGARKNNGAYVPYSDYRNQLQYRRDEIMLRKAHGLCTTCGKVNAANGKTMCESCLQKLRERSKKRYLKKEVA